MEEEVLEANEGLRMLQQITESVHKSLDIDEVFKEITEGVVNTLGYTTSLIFELSDDKKYFEIRSYFAKKRLLPKINKILGYHLNKFSFPADPGLNSAVKSLMEKRAVVAERLEEILHPVLSKKKCSALQRLRGTKNYIIAPLKVEEEVVGGIFISSSEEKVSEQELSLIESFADAASTAVKNARLYEHSKRREEKLRESEGRYKFLLDNSNEYIVIISKKGKIVFVNKAVINNFGYSKEELIGKRVNQFLARGCVKKALYALKEEFLGHPQPDIEIQAKTKSGEIRHLKVPKGSTPVHEKGKLLGLMINVVDITEQKKAIKNLKESERRFRELWNEAPIAYHTLNREGIITSVNQTEAKMLGYNKGEMEGRSIFEFILPKQREEARERFKKKLSGKRVPRAKDRMYVKKDGSNIYVSIDDKLEYDKSGKVIGVRTAMVDITGSKQAEQQLEKRAAQSELLYKIGQRVSSKLSLDKLLSEIVNSIRDAFDYNSVMLLFAEPEEKCLRLQSIAGRYTNVFCGDFCIKLGEGMIGYAAATGKTQVSSDVSRNPYYIRLADTNTKSELSVPIQREGKTLGVLDIQSDEYAAFNEADVVSMETLSSQIASAIENAHLYEKAKREIEERKRAEEEVKASLKEKEVLLQEIHHRVKNNLQIILSLLRLQSSYVKDKRDIELFRESKNRIRSMALIHEKLYESKNFASINFAHYLQKFTTHLFHTFMIDPNVIRLKTEVEDVFIDINRAIPCALIINELASNALKYAFPEGQKGEVKIRLYTDKKGKINLVVSDNGIGLPENVDLHSPQSLGMQIVNGLVKQIKGTIDVDRKGGTTFMISF